MWHSNVKSWDTQNIDIYRFVHHEAEKKLSESISDSEKITGRAYHLIGLLIIIISGLLAFVVDHLSAGGELLAISPFLIESLVIVWIFYSLYKLIKKREIYNNGTDPCELFTASQLEVAGDIEGDNEKRIMLFVIEQSQYKITYMENNNQERTKEFNNCLRLLIYSLFGFLLASSVAITLF